MVDRGSIGKSIVDVEAGAVAHKRMGSKYGGWMIPEVALSGARIVYAFGAGEDISFDLMIARDHGVDVHIFDPTPRAAQHFQKVSEGVAVGQPERVTRDPEMIQCYKIGPEDFKRVSFHGIGIWDKDETVKFFSPKDERHVSHSITNLQKTSTYFEAPVRRFSTIVADLGGTMPDIVKIDIEGAEYRVLADICTLETLPKVIGVEYDELFHGIDQGVADRITASADALKAAGYVCTHVDIANFVFLRRDLLGAATGGSSDPQA